MRTPRAAAVPVWTAVLCSVAVLVAGCAGGPAPRAWAASVCQALAPWRTTIADLTTSTREQMTARTSPAQAKEHLVRLFGGAERVSDQARRDVEDAGVPDVERGEAVARGFVASLTGVRDAYGRARRSIEQLDTGRAEEFYAGVHAAVAVLNREYDASALDLGALDSPELKRAFEEVPECR
ncbi:MAG TPA: hypothetical protein VF462_11110 [Micromonosporaceae bacterium]